MLLSHGARVELERKSDGESALTMAASEGALPIVEMLVAAGADAGHSSRHGTALSQARKAGHASIVSFLERAARHDTASDFSHARRFIDSFVWVNTAAKPWGEPPDAHTEHGTRRESVRSASPQGELGSAPRTGSR